MLWLLSLSYSCITCGYDIYLNSHQVRFDMVSFYSVGGEVMHKLRLVHGHHKKCLSQPLAILHIRAPQGSRDKLNLAKKVLPSEKVPRDQVICLTPNWCKCQVTPQKTREVGWNYLFSEQFPLWK